MREQFHEDLRLGHRVSERSYNTEEPDRLGRKDGNDPDRGRSSAVVVAIREHLSPFSCRLTEKSSESSWIGDERVVLIV
jgi:hypothetical protein